MEITDSYFNPFSLLEVSLVEDGERQVNLETAANVSDGTELSVEIDPADITFQDDSLEVDSTKQKLEHNSKKLAGVTEAEKEFRRTSYRNINIVPKKRLHCTICDQHIGCFIQLHGISLVHPLLKVLVCVTCHDEYIKIERFEGESYACETRCRWCGKIASPPLPPPLVVPHSGLRFCTTCPYAFCEMCIYRNLPVEDSGKTENWICFVCRLRELWPPRALVWALVKFVNYMAKSQVKDDVWYTDMSTCCKKRGSGKGRVVPRNAQKVWPPLQTSPLAQVSTPAVNGSDKRLMDTKWLKSKIQCTTANMTAIQQKLKTLKDSIPDTCDEALISNKLDSLFMLLSVMVNQVRESEADLRRDWDSRKRSQGSILYMLCNDKNAEVQLVPSKKPMSYRPILPKAKDNDRPYKPSIKRRKKESSEASPKSDRVHPPRHCSLIAKYNIKECFVKLNKCDPPIE